MEKNQVQYFREKYKGRPTLIICDNEHNFFDNFPGRCLPIWDDDLELVTFLESDHEFSGMANADFPYVEVVTPYACIQSFRVFTDRETIMGFLNDTKSKLGNDAYEYAKKNINILALNQRPKREPYYKE